MAKGSLSWALNKNPKVGQDEQGNKVAPLQIDKDFGDAMVTIRKIEEGDIIRIWNKEGLLISTYVVGDYEKKRR